MKKFLITTTIKKEIEAIDEDEALEKFCIEAENEPQQTTADYLYDHLKCEEIEDIKEKTGKIVIANINIEIPTDARTDDEAIIEAENFELPEEYVEDSFEIVKVIDNN